MLLSLTGLGRDCSRGPGTVFVAIAWGSSVVTASALRIDLSAASHKCLNLLWNLQRMIAHFHEQPAPCYVNRQIFL